MGLMYDNLLLTLMSGTNAPVDYSEPFYYRSPDLVDWITIEKSTSSAPDLTIEVSLDKTNWTTIGTTAVPSGQPNRYNSTIYIMNGVGRIECCNMGTTVFMSYIPDGQKLYIRGTSSDGYKTGTDTDYNYINFGAINGSGKTEIGGNILSLVYGSNFNGQETMPVGTRLSCLFRQTVANTFVNHCGINYSNRLVFPKNTQSNCYSHLFEDCRGNKFPEMLPATTLSNSCYSSMFKGTNIQTPTILPATTLQHSCYLNMFRGTLLTTAPELPATTLAQSCYEGMFGECTSLTQAPTLPVTTLATGCYENMFTNCTSLTTAPELPATTLAERCYESMFDGCTSLNYVKCLATDISASSCTLRWLKDVSSTGVFVKDVNMSSWTTGESGIPTGWTVQNA